MTVSPAPDDLQTGALHEQTLPMPCYAAVRISDIFPENRLFPKNVGDVNPCVTGHHKIMSVQIPCLQAVRLLRNCHSLFCGALAESDQIWGNF